MYMYICILTSTTNTIYVYQYSTSTTNAIYMLVVLKHTLTTVVPYILYKTVLQLPAKYNYRYGTAMQYYKCILVAYRYGTVLYIVRSTCTVLVRYRTVHRMVYY